MPRTVDETEWLTRSTAPLRLARFIQRRTSKRKLQLLSGTMCRLVKHYATPEFRSCLDAAMSFAHGEMSSSDYRNAIRHTPATLRFAPPGEVQRLAPEFLANRAILSAISSNVVSGIVRAMEWVLYAGRDDATIPTQICDLFREIIGNPFRLWRIQPPWLAPGVRIAPDGSTLSISSAAFDLAREIDRSIRFDLLPLLADELESAGLTDPGLIHHCRNGTHHLRGCWAVDLVLGKE